MPNSERNFSVGEVVDLEHANLAVSRIYQDDTDRWWIELCTPHLRYGPVTIQIPLASVGTNGVLLRRRRPADGVPTVGQLWADRKGQLYFVRKDDVHVLLVPEKDTDELRRREYPWLEIHNSDWGPIFCVAARPQWFVRPTEAGDERS